MLDFLSTLFQLLIPLWEMSLTAAYAAAVVIVLRLLLKKRAPKQVLCLLWLVVFARLLIPVSLESPLSIVPNALPGQAQEVQLPSQNTEAESPGSPIQPQAPGLGQTQTSPAGGTVTPVISNPGNSALAVPEGTAPSLPRQPAQTGFPWRAVIAGVWLAGAAGMAGYALFTYLRLRRLLFDAIRDKDGAWEHPDIESPFILGMLRPRIYLPVGLVGQPRRFILCHERAHLRRRDHIVKPVCWIALALHWFNPLVWAAFILMSRDIESACDEAVVRRLGDQVKADYSTTLLALATGPHAPTPCPLAFDEGDTKGRIQNVLRYRRPALWVTVVSVIAAVLAAVCLLTDPVAAQEGPEGTPGPDASPSQTAGEGLNALLDPWMKELLDGERSFIGEAGQSVSINWLNPMFYGEPEEMPPVIMSSLTIIDLDRDGINELVIYPGEQLDQVGYLILRRQGDDVYGYAPYRGCGDLKADGTFEWSGGALNWGVSSAVFDETGFNRHNISWYSSSDGEEGLCFVEGRKADREEFDAAMIAQNAKPGPTWYVYKDGQLEYAPITADDFSIPAPDFLDPEQQALYYNTLITYLHLFSPDSGSVNPNGHGTAQPVERNGRRYYPDTGVYGSWDEFEQTVLSVFTRDFWNDRNADEIYINIGGTMHYLDYARGSGSYNKNFPETFRLVEKTDDTVTFLMTGYYSSLYLLDGETSEQRASRLAANWEYSIDFPMRMVKTEDGWRFDEFYYAAFDEDRFLSSAQPNPELTPPASTAPGTAAPASICAHGLEDVRLEYVGSQLAARCNQCDFTYLIPGVTSDNWSGSTGNGDGNGWMKEDVDGDAHTEVLVYTTNNQVVSLKEVDGALVSSSFDLLTLVNAFNKNRTYTLDFDSKTMEVSYNGHTKQATLDNDVWDDMTNQSGGLDPEISPTDYWGNRLLFGYYVYGAGGRDLGITAFWSLSYNADGRLQIGSFFM